MVDYTDPEQDVPSPIDLRDPADARAWADAAETARPGRPQIRSAFAEALRELPQRSRVLELGSGPGFLAETVLSECPDLASYTLFDFSEPMLAMSRERLAGFPRAEFVLGDFKAPGWQRGSFGSRQEPYDAVISMQAVHEIRHKRHVPGLYREVRDLLRPEGCLLVADHTPVEDSLRSSSLHMTADEQLAALIQAGFSKPHLVLTIGRLVLVRAQSGH